MGSGTKNGVGDKKGGQGRKIIIVVIKRVKILVCDEVRMIGNVRMDQKRVFEWF